MVAVAAASATQDVLELYFGSDFQLDAAVVSVSGLVKIVLAPVAGVVVIHLS